MKNIQVRLLQFRPNMTIIPTTTKVKTKTFLILSSLIILDRVPTEMKLAATCANNSGFNTMCHST